MTDGTYSYTIFTYKCGLMEWDNGATIGFSAAGNPYANHDPSSSAAACVNTPESDWSNVVYLLSNASPEDPAPREFLSATHVIVFNWLSLYIFMQRMSLYLISPVPLPPSPGQ